MNLRAQAANAVAAVLRGRSLDDALPAEADGFTRALVYGVIREHALLDWLCSELLDKAVTGELRALLLCGIYQLRSMDVAAHAAVNETVNACDVLKHPKARGLVNAILRRYQREQGDLQQRQPLQPELKYSHPSWLVKQLQTDWPQQWQEILERNNQQGPLVLRVNRRRGPRDGYLRRLQAEGIAASAVAGASDAVLLAEARGVATIPGFAEGLVSVQDASAQFAADLLELADGQRVLDACAAPGGKTAHILERCDAEVLAVDSDAMRLRKVDDTLMRLGLKAKTLNADAGTPSTWWDDRPFDRILIDAPCSGTGVIRRHPDIKWLRRDTDIVRLARQQLRLLSALWPLLSPGGVMLYATCSLLRAEGESIAAALPGANAEALPIDADWGEAMAPGRRIAPGGPQDGFYYARWRKKA